MRVSLFVTCLVDALHPAVGVSTVRLLRRLGVTVEFPQDQVCCGQPAFNSGYVDQAREAAIQMVGVFQDSEYVVTPSGSCASMVRNYYPELFRRHPMEEQALAFADKTFELTQFIVEVLGIREIGGYFPGRATYHTSCHMTRGLGVQQAPLQLLGSVGGLDLVDLPFKEECCGFGGTFAVKMANLSTRMADEKLEHVVSTGADYLVGSDMACLMHLGGRLRQRGLPIKVIHTAELLERATAAEQAPDWRLPASRRREGAS